MTQLLNALVEVRSYQNHTVPTRHMKRKAITRSGLVKVIRLSWGQQLSSPFSVQALQVSKV